VPHPRRLLSSGSSYFPTCEGNKKFIIAEEVRHLMRMGLNPNTYFTRKLSSKSVAENMKGFQ
jgi:hypothetical protein